MRLIMKDGIIELGSPFAAELGFVKEKFTGYLWKRGEMILISFVTSKQPNKGHFSGLLKTIWDKGFSVGVPTPLGKMQSILEKKGFQPYRDEDCILWVKGCAKIITIGKI